MRRRQILLGALGAVLLYQGRRAVASELAVRTDIEPLRRRLHLPEGPLSVRWVAVSPVLDSGLLPPRAEFYEMFAYVMCEAAALQDFTTRAGEPVGGATVVLPEAVAVAILPPDVPGGVQMVEKGRQVAGAAYSAEALSQSRKTWVHAAIRLGNALLITFRAS